MRWIRGFTVSRYRPVRDATGDMLVQITSEAVGRYSSAEQAATVFASRSETGSEVVPENRTGR